MNDGPTNTSLAELKDVVDRLDKGGDSGGAPAGQHSARGL